MRAGDLDAAWRVGDRALARHAGAQCGDLPPHLRWVWDGTPLAGRSVLVRCHHGLGDTIQFARFLPRLARVARQVMVLAQEPLAPALARIAPGCDFSDQSGAEVEVEIMELPHALRVGRGELWPGGPYLRVPPAPKPSRQFNVGIVATAGGWDKRRSMPAGLLEALSRLPDVARFNLVPDEDIPWAAGWSTPDVIVAAMRLRALDLVVSVDTFLAHLAAAAGARTWVLLPEPADWRWATGPRTPWYPAARLFRQPAPGAWEPVAERVVREVAAAQPSRLPA
ncbi:MAG TPA: hypothetical protein VK009_11630, partial [Chloroflexota bacterium]|nr:hypothetical protein [Chloroflexota bacterium]